MLAVLTADVTVAISSDDERYITQPLPGDWRIVEIHFCPATALATHATAYITVTITTNDGAAGADSSAIASFTTITGGTALVLKTNVDLTITHSSATTLSQGAGIKIAKVETAAGGALDGCFTFVLEKVP